MYLHNQIHYFITALAMNCIFKDGRDLVQMLERTLPFLHEANLEFTEDGLIMHSIDSTHIVLVDNCLRLSCFESYTIDKGKFGLDIYNVLRILRHYIPASERSQVSLSIEGEELKLSVQRLDGSMVHTILPSSTLDTETWGIPAYTPDSTVTFTQSTYKIVCEELKNVVGPVLISCDSKQACFEGTALSHSNDNDVKRIQCMTKPRDGALECLRILSLKEYDGYFGDHLLQKLCPAEDSYDLIYFKFTNDMPLCVEYPIGVDGYVRIYIAPTEDC